MKPFIIYKRFNNFDEFAHVVQAWDLDFKQLDNGYCKTDLLQFASSNIHISHAKYSRRFDQHGSPPSGKWTFAIFSEQTPPIVWHEQEINNNFIALFKPGSEIDCVTQSGFEVFTFSYTEEYLNAIGANLGLPEINKLANGTDTFKCRMLELSEIRRQLRQIIHTLKNCSLENVNFSLIQRLEIEFAEHILMILAKSVPVTSNSLRARNRAIKQIKQYLSENPADPVTVSQLCKVTGASIRTLQYAFLEHYGVSPKTYLKCFRLNGVRKELWGSDPDSKRVNDISSLWGFWHMGQFAGDYRKLFGELPSETLNRKKCDLQA